MLKHSVQTHQHGGHQGSAVTDVHDHIVVESPRWVRPVIATMAFLLAVGFGVVTWLILQRNQSLDQRLQLACQVQRLGGTPIDGVRCPPKKHKVTPSTTPTPHLTPTPTTTVVFVPGEGTRTIVMQSQPQHTSGGGSNPPHSHSPSPKPSSTKPTPKPTRCVTTSLASVCLTPPPSPLLLGTVLWW